jgi:hypothetical protein
MIMTKLTIADIADEMFKVFELEGEALGVTMEELHNRVKAQEADPEAATKMLTVGFSPHCVGPTRKNCASSQGSSLNPSRQRGASQTNPRQHWS